MDQTYQGPHTPNTLRAQFAAQRTFEGFEEVVDDNTNLKRIERDRVGLLEEAARIVQAAEKAGGRAAAPAGARPRA